MFTRGVTWIERRQLLRTSLSPTENAQIDALHTVLVVVMKRIVSILRELQQFETFETLSVEEMSKSRLLHTVNADPGSEFLGRTMDKLSHEVRKEIVVGLENELLDLAAVPGPRTYPALDTSRDEWMRLRTERQKLIRENGTFFMREQTSALVVSVPRSFTGDGIIAWFRRRPSVLWDDNALCAAGYVENVTPELGFGKRTVLLECRDDRYYRLREVDMWMESSSRTNSLFPLDLVREIDCYRGHILWDWKYCLFVPSRKHLYIYENETSTSPVAYIDVASAVCKAAYNFSNDANGGWMDLVNPTVCMTKTRLNGDKVIEVKTSSTQKWVQALARSGVCVEMRPGQEVLMKRLNPIILQQKCNKHATEFDPNDLEGSFQRLLNRLFGHDKGLTHQDYEKERRELRTQVRSELKKAGAQGDTVMAYYGRGKIRKSKPVNSGNFKNDSLYSGRIIRIRTPFTDEKYPFKTAYDMTDINEVPAELSKLLTKYKVTDKASWLSLSKAQRDMFLLYDVEYTRANERIVEEGLMRGHIRTSEGDLDPQKVSERCFDLNILFKNTDLEDCVSRMVKHRYRHKPLGVLKIHTKMLSPHRPIDAWYPLAPASDMLQRTNLGQVRVELQLSKALFAVGREPSVVKVSILEGRNLPVADMLTSDPFVEIFLLDQDSKERDTSLKTDVKMKSLNPKWENQEFLLGKSERTRLSDKKGILLRVTDYDAASANDPMGCVTIEFLRTENGYIRGLVLKQADAYGNADTQELTLDGQHRVEVDAMLLPVSGKQKIKKKPAPDGVLGKLRFIYTCSFLPHGEGGSKMKYDSASEDLGAILGRTYDLSKVNYFDVRLASESTGRVFEGQLGKSDGATEFSLTNPNQCASFRDETVVLTERDAKDTVALKFDLNLIGIQRADRIRRLVADTFRLVGLAFDSRTFNHSGGRYNLEQLNKDLLAQVRVMSQALTLHWKATPQLLGYVLELVLLSGENDRLSYANAVALDAVLHRWSRVLMQVTEARDYLTGNCHGKKTPQLIEKLFTECDWTGVNFPFFKHAGVVVDTQLRGGRFVAARIVKECGGGLFNIKICTHPDAPYLVEYLDSSEPHEDSKLSTLGTNCHVPDSVRSMAKTLENLWWGSDKIVKVYALLPGAVKSLQVRNATTNKLVPTTLMERNEDQPRFVGQYHGFVKGETFDKQEAEQLELVYSAVCRRELLLLDRSATSTRLVMATLGNTSGSVSQCVPAVCTAQ
ncbi:uncharacterized protein PITG_04835 [Phytophthora infestans T30-4]|uniref:C2 domain-containing protein n=1 Tax=Phytophthora infestans (strain T30-4) TaxID=403677 RepID=D0N250_PHYIT|nr:uncharacterized protein PITG_04835 [Phytophthora infestans T30-4]EEY68379.1 hypothetical protein PITG_04835 [Phytophthora infestans T30-4]|eukprot:XP_002905538.1 hypothetical protein PITG_04835 [Phytophthora infestans T30-4]